VTLVTSNEIWKDIKEYEGLYRVSNHGKVFSMRKTRLLKIGFGRIYGNVELRHNGTRKRIAVHRLVAMHFVENPRSLNMVNHLDEDKTNNIHSNLEWVTPKENTRHSWRLNPLRFKYKRSLTDDQARDVKYSKKTYNQLAEEYSIDKKTIWAIRKGTTYKEL